MSSPMLFTAKFVLSECTVALGNYDLAVKIKNCRVNSTVLKYIIKIINYTHLKSISLELLIKNTTSLLVELV